MKLIRPRRLTGMKGMQGITAKTISRKGAKTQRGAEQGFMVKQKSLGRKPLSLLSPLSL